MIKRPRPDEDEDDLLKLQEQFLAFARADRPSVEVKRPDKRKTNGQEKVESRDVVTMEENETLRPIQAHPVTPAKKSKFRSESGHAPDLEEINKKGSRQTSLKVEDEQDMEECIDRHDSGLAAVLTTIIERDTRNETYGAPILAKQAFPKAMHIEQTPENKVQNMITTKSKKRSLFAQHVEAHSTRPFGVEPVPQRFLIKSESLQIRDACSSTAVLPTLPGSCVIDGIGLGVSNSQSESQRIHEENVEMLSSMSEKDILEEQHRVLQLIDPKLVQFLRNKRKAKEESTKFAAGVISKEVSFSVHKEIKKKQNSEAVSAGKPEQELPVTLNSDWVNMSTLEREKLEWIKDLQPPPSVSSLTGRPARFDFQGNLMAIDADVPVNMGLHHHGQEPERAGYTLEEIFLLARSSNLQQRSLALHTLSRIISQAKSGYLSGKIETPIIPAILAGGVVMLLRWALDDTVEATVAAAIDAIHALLWNSFDKEAVDITWVSHHGNIANALTPTATLEQEDQPEDLDEENREEETDSDVIRRDVIQALVQRMDLLIRFRYIFQSMRPQAATVVQMFNILSRVAQHSSNMAYEVVKCPGLVETVFREFLPTAWIPADNGRQVSCLYGLPVSSAMHFVQIVCQAGRNLASILVSRFHLDMILLRYLAVQNSNLELPQIEAVNLQVETLAVWRVCVAYGLTMQTYFDMYSSILLTLGKLESRWSSSLDSTHAELTVSDSCTLDSRMVCVLERILFVAGSTHQQQGFNSRNDAGIEAITFPSTNWSHVTALFHPIRACTVHILSDLGLTYPVKKQKLALPTACLNFVASYYELEGKQSGIDEISSLEDIEAFCKTCVLPLWSSHGLSVIIESLSSCSNLLAAATSLPSETASNLPSLCVCQVAENEETISFDSHTTPEKWEKNMPILLPHSPFAFLVALLRLMLAVCKRQKSLISEVMDLALNKKDILIYMSKTCSHKKSPFNTAFLTRGENLFQYYWLKCCCMMSCKEMALAHRVALQLISRAHQGDEHLVHDLISTVVFSPSFLSEGEEAQLVSQAMKDLNLSETLHVKSATQEEINISRHHLLQETYSSLAKIRGHFFQAFGGMEKAVQDSRSLFMGNPQGMKTQLIRGGEESLMPRDWMFMPLIHIYNKTTQMKSVTGGSLSPQSVSMVTSVLHWVYALEMWRPAEMETISVTLRLTRVMCAFIAGSDLFLEKPVNQCLGGLLRVFTAPRLLDRMDYDEKIPGIVSFYDLYQELLDHYEAVSFGDAVFGLYVLLPLQQKHNSLLRKAVWGERRKMLRTLRLPLKEMLIPIHNYLQPEESDLELLQLYLSALITRAVQPVWSPVMYLIAVHHINRFIYLSLDDGNGDVRAHAWRQILADESKVSDVIYYKQANTSKPKGMDLYEKLPPSRQTTLEQMRSSIPL